MATMERERLHEQRREDEHFGHERKGECFVLRGKCKKERRLAPIGKMGGVLN